MNIPDFLNDKSVTGIARKMRFIFIQGLRNGGELSEDEAMSLLAGNLSPDDDATFFDDSQYLDQFMDEDEVLRDSEYFLKSVDCRNTGR